MLQVGKILVPAWNPAVHVSDMTFKEGTVLDFLNGVSLGYEAPEITFDQLGAAIVTGSFGVKSEELGVIRDSFYLRPDLPWEQTVRAHGTLSRFDRDLPALVIGNIAADNYYHWTFQCLASLLLYRKLSISTDFVTVMPNLRRWQSETLSIIDLEGERLELDRSDIVYFLNTVRSNLSGGRFSWSPHPSVIAEFEELSRTVHASRKFGKKIYASRRDARTTRPIVNEDAVCALMEAHGFEVLTPGQLSVEEQVVAFRDAEIIVGPHGAGMTNLLYAGTAGGARVVELFQAGAVNGCYAKICQAKGLDYTAIINPDAFLTDSTGTPIPLRSINDLACEADLGLIESVVSKL